VSGEAQAVRRRESGQVAFLILFLAIAFFTTVVLVVNTGRSVALRVENQGAVDAAVVSAASGLAQGLNHIASNNLVQARATAAIVSLRALRAATADANAELDRVEAALAGLKDPTAPSATVLRARVQEERRTLNELAAQLAELAVLDAGAAAPERESGQLWDALRWLSLHGEALATSAPHVAAAMGHVAYQNRDNVQEFRGANLRLVPELPPLPVCRGGRFRDLAQATAGTLPDAVAPFRNHAERQWVVSVLRGAFDRSLEEELEALFTGVPPPAASPSDGITPEVRLAKARSRMSAPPKPPPPLDPHVFGAALVDSPRQDAVHPILLDASEWPGSFTVFGLATRPSPEPMLSTVFRRAAETTVTYAAARVHAPASGDLWTPNWRAKLVRADVRDLQRPRSPVFGACGSDAEAEGPEGNGLAGFQSLQTILGVSEQH
jgi:hypothetical protein